jgi:endonuclease/exonuclease/phosphatase family metal-dependent hydrolase
MIPNSRHCSIVIALLVACAGELEPEDDRDTPVDEPLDFDEPADPLEPDPIDEPEVEVADVEIGARARLATYRVLHWNIAGGKVNDCRPAGIAAAVRRLVREHDIQFVGLNEVCPEQYDAIHAELRQLWGKPASARFSAYVRDGKPRIIGNAIFSRLDLDQITRNRLGEDQYGDRNLLCGRLAARPHLRFCSTHLTPGDDKARTQLARVFDQLERWWSERRDTILIAGDFNLRPDDPGLNAVYSQHANHALHNPNNHGSYRELDDNDPDHCKGYGERSTPNHGGGPCGNGGRIDMIFARQNRVHELRYGSDAMNIPATCDGACSDHRPVRGHVRAIVRVD